jgi:hypothetical protein
MKYEFNFLSAKRNTKTIKQIIEDMGKQIFDYVKNETGFEMQYMVKSNSIDEAHLGYREYTNSRVYVNVLQITKTDLNGRFILLCGNEKIYVDLIELPEQLNKLVQTNEFNKTLREIYEKQSKIYF